MARLPRSLNPPATRQRPPRPAPQPEDPYSAGVLIGLVMIATAFRILVLANEAYPLYGDEAQYWVWSQTLEWGYFTKPPMIAWLIRATTGLFGDREFGVRFLAPLLHGASACLLYAVGRTLYDKKIGFWSALAWVSLPAISLSSLLMTTDVPALFFWALGLACFAIALDERQPIKRRQFCWIGLGLAIGLGLLSRYTMALFVLSMGLYIATSARHVLRERWLWISLALGAACIAPNVIWNLDHGLATFRHTGANANLGGPLFHPMALIAFIGSQFGVFGPILFTALICLGVTLKWNRSMDKRAWLLISFAAPPLILALVIALASRAHANWAAASYLSATILVVQFLYQGVRRRRVLYAALILDVAIAAVGYSYHDLASKAGIQLTRKTDPFSRLMGGRELGRAVSSFLQERGGAVLMTDDRMLFATLAFYVHPRPPQVEYNWKPYPGDQFELTTDIHDVGDQQILYVTTDDKPTALDHFAQVDRIGSITLPIHTDFVQHYAIFMLHGYHD